MTVVDDFVLVGERDCSEREVLLLCAEAFAIAAPARVPIVVPPDVGDGVNLKHDGAGV